jgi:uncharacterized protein YjbI with pentapeptide repeats
VETGIIGTGITVEQLYSTRSYRLGDLTEIDFGGNNLAGVHLVGKILSNASFSGDWFYSSSPGANLTNANLSQAILHNADFRGATLTGANLTGADSRGSLLSDPILADAILTNFIHSNGRMRGLELGAGQMLLVRDYDGLPAQGVMPLPIAVDQHFAIAAGGTLRIVLEADAWGSTISFDAGIPVTLGGTLELTFANDVDLATQVGRTFDLFDWTGVTPAGQFSFSSPYTWNLSDLYSTGEITLFSIPEPSALVLTTFGILCLIISRRRNTS